MQTFDELLSTNKAALERYVRFRLSSKTDADDVLQDICLTAYLRFAQLRSAEAFKPWLISIARNKCNDYFREKAAQLEIPLERLTGRVLVPSRCGPNDHTAVHETLNLLGSTDKQMLYLYYWKELPQAEISKRLKVPLGTVKSRLHTAKRHFKNKYPLKGDKNMKKLPPILPEYKIEESPLPPFHVKWEELMGWFLVPKLGEKISWGMYDLPERKLGETDIMTVVGKAEVHGIEGVEIKVHSYSPMDCNSEGGQDEVERSFVAQLTDTHCRCLAESHVRDGVRKYYTFLDGESFLDNWGFGEDNCGNETNLAPKGIILRHSSVITSADQPFLLDIVGRYTVTIGGKTYGTVCVMDIETYNGGTVSEQFLDKNGRTILWRRFNHNAWAIDRYKHPWTELLPDNERLTVNGSTYVHWYDCITDYIL